MHGEAGQEQRIARSGDATGNPFTYALRKSGREPAYPSHCLGIVVIHLTYLEPEPVLANRADRAQRSEAFANTTGDHG